MVRIFITRPHEEAVLRAAECLGDCTVRNERGCLSPAEMVRALTDFDAVMCTFGDNFSADIFSQVPNPRCKFLANFGVGINHVDVKRARQAGIVVTNTPGVVSDATADLAVALIIMSCRRLSAGERFLREGRWNGWEADELRGMHVTGKTVGIVGLGRVGSAIGRRCHAAFNCSIHYFCRTEKIVDFPVTRHATLVDLARCCDIFVVAVPGSADTYHMIDEEVFKAMPRHSHFVNVARGDVVDEAALIAALKGGEIDGAGLDVYEFEPNVSEEMLKLKNVTLIPHLGTACNEVRVNMGLLAVENMKQGLAGSTPPNLVE